MVVEETHVFALLAVVLAALSKAVVPLLFDWRASSNKKKGFCTQHNLIGLLRNTSATNNKSANSTKRRRSPSL